MKTSNITQCTVSLAASVLLTLAMVEVIADHAIVDAGPLIVVQAQPATTMGAVLAQPSTR